MKIFENKEALKQYVSEQKAKGNSVGFVPTMGALHKGHLSLVEKARRKNDLVVVSIFVNPTQFDNKEDLEKYPKTMDNDIKLLESVNCDVVYIPTAKEIYDGRIESERFNFDGLEYQMEGNFRPGHFDGVGTIVKKLFEIVQPDNAYFGKKDFQQLQIIKKMVENEGLNVKIKGCRIYREPDGLAMSSRNMRLSIVHREEAPFIYKILKKVKKKAKKKAFIELVSWVKKKFKHNDLLELQYFVIANEQTLIPASKREHGREYRAFIAVYAGNIRLIDNIKI